MSVYVCMLICCWLFAAGGALSVYAAFLFYIHHWTFVCGVVFFLLGAFCIWMAFLELVPAFFIFFFIFFIFLGGNIGGGLCPGCLYT